jgi:hypothetical protein
MRRLPFAMALVLLFAAAVAFGQENRMGAGRFEISALPGGGMFFTDSADELEPEFGNYVVGGAFAYNLNRWIGIEGEAGSLVGIRQTVTFNDLTLNDQHTPFMFGYTGNLIVNPWGSDRPFVPFVTGGLGGLTMFDTDEVANLGITSKTTFLTGNVGGGMRWFANRHWGVRGDYRLMLVDGKETAPAFFGRESVRYGHRVSAGLLFTY